MTRKVPKPSDQGLKSLTFSKPVLITFAAIFVAIGCYVIYRSFASTPPNGGVTTANIWLSASGSDSGANCKRSATATTAPTASTACASPDKADQLAVAGDTIGVIPGTYKGVTTNYGYPLNIIHANQATFACQSGAAADSVVFDSAGFLFGPGAGNITFSGNCFHFHVLVIGLRGYDSSTNAANRVHDININGAHVDSFDITGVNNVTIQNSQIGPIDACFGAGKAAAFGAPSSAECSASNPTEAYWATQTDGTQDVQDEPFVHNNGGDLATNVTLDKNHFTGMQTKWPNVFHQGGLLVWGTSGLTLENNTFDHNAIYNIEFNAGTSESNGTFQNNVFGKSVYTLADGSNSAKPLPDGQCQDGMQDPSGTSTFTNELWRYNTFVQCFDIGQYSGFSNTRVVGNLIGDFANCTANGGVTYNHNASGQGESCQGGISISGDPFNNSAGSDFSLPAGSSAANYVPCSSGDAHLTTDILGNSRPGATNCSAGAYETGASQSGGGGSGVTGQTFICTGRSFYVDYASGSDGNNGTSKTTPWKRSPGMNGFAGSYSHQAGDCFYFKGGVSWPNSAFPLKVGGSGTASKRDYYGPDYSWYSGASWTRPIFDAGAATMGTGANDEFVTFNGQSYVTLDNFEMKGFRIQGTDTSPNDQCQYVYLDGGHNTVSNNYMHGFSWATGAGDQNVCIIVDDHASASTITKNVFDGADSLVGGKSGLVGTFCRGCADSFSNNICNDLPNCWLGSVAAGQSGTISGNLVQNCTLDFDSSQHENAIESVSSSGGTNTLYVHDNVIHDTMQGCEALFLGNTGETDYVWNNVFYNLGGNSPEFDAGTAVYIWNNTVVPASGRWCFQAGRNPDTWTGAFEVKNNHCVSTSGNVYDNSTDGHQLYSPVPATSGNVLQTPAAASAQGYSASQANSYSPTASGSATVGAGANLSAVCSGGNSGLCSGTAYACTYDTISHSASCPGRGLTARTTSWDAGAFQYSSGGSGSVTGDINGDGSVNVFDLSILLTNYGHAGTASQGDLNADGIVNVFDLSILLTDYGN